MITLCVDAFFVRSNMPSVVKTLTLQVCSANQALMHLNLNDKEVLSSSYYIVEIKNSDAHTVTTFHIFTA